MSADVTATEYLYGVDSTVSDDSRFYEPPRVVQFRKPVKPDLAALRAEMAAAHPDRGGTDEAFIAARQRYEQARGAAA